MKWKSKAQQEGKEEQTGRRVDSKWAGAPNRSAWDLCSWAAWSGSWHANNDCWPVCWSNCDGSLNPKASSPVKIANPQDVDVVITKTGFTEPGRPTVLAKHSAKEEHVEPHKVRFDITNYAQLGIGELYSGFLSQVHSSRDLVVDMVKHMDLKFEVWSLQLLDYAYPASPQVYYLF